MTRRELTWEWVDGMWAGIFPIRMRMPQIPEDAPHELRESLARRRLVAAGYRCPGCGVDLDSARRLDYRAEPDVPTISVNHAADCLGADDVNLRLLRAWVDGGEP